MTRKTPRIVILGGGFGGVYAATYLGRSELAIDGAKITLLDQKNYFTFSPLLAEVAAGSLDHRHVTYPLRLLGRRFGFDFIQAQVREIDLQRQVVHAGDVDVGYDYLVIAVGAAPRYFGNDDLRRHSLPLTTVDDARAIRNRVIETLERATKIEDASERARWLTFVVAGAGPAGVEVASEIQTLANDVLKPYYPGVPPVQVILVNGEDRILPGWDDVLAAEGLAKLRERGIDVRLETRITGAGPGVITTKDKNSDREASLAAETLIWTAGTAPPNWIAEIGLPTERGAIVIDPLLRVNGFDNVYAIGDVATLVDERSHRPYPPVAPIAISQGVRAAGNIENHVLGRPLEPYQAHHAGKIISLGAGVALIDLLGFKITGKPAWFIYRAAYLAKLVGLQNKLQVLFTLAMNRIFEPDIAGGAARRT
ncbi:MAG: NAD(P)/FAD-dependent oxidoreductase [Gemmatimonadetes bacterium]|nr:NAD(P)/FAD-dependent oxidoreductase [Gemmatimonadota bacterium]